jgi:hypothetical protein
LNIAFHGEQMGVMLFRKFFVWYARGMALRELKLLAFSAATREEMLRLIGKVQTLRDDSISSLQG